MDKRHFVPKFKGTALTVMLVGLAIVGPLVAYAGVSVIWPSSTVTADVDETPPINFTAGADHATASTMGYAGTFTEANNKASFTVTVNGLSGGQVTIDNFTHIRRDAAVSSYKLQVATAYSGTLNPDTFKVRLWTGATAPTADDSAGVCGVLDLEASASTETTGTCTAADVFVQVVLALPSGQTTESGTVSLRPSSIVFA